MGNVSRGLKGISGVLSKLAKFVKDAPGAAGAALYEEALAIDAIAVKLVPVDSGRLRATHYVSPPLLRAGDIEIEVGFGTDYAIYVHERTELAHKVGQAKFLELAFLQRMPGFYERLAKRTKRNILAGITMPPIDPNTPTSPQDVGRIITYGPSRRHAEPSARYRARQAKKARNIARAKKAAEHRKQTRAKRTAERRASRAEKKFLRKVKKQHRADLKRAKRLARKNRGKR